MIKRLLVANRGEIAIRISRTAADLGVATIAIYAADDHLSLHTRHADESVSLETQGVAAYLNIERIIQIAKKTGCDAVHPGYGFLSESAEFAQACEDADLIYVGPAPATLKQFGDKAAARSLAEQCEVPVLPGISRAVSSAEAKEFMQQSESRGIMLKAIAGGGGRGMRPVLNASELDEAFARASSEAETAFGSGELYVEELLPRARHIEVQIVGDGSGRAVHLWDRECSLQRQRQKVIEIAPAYGVPKNLRDAMLNAAVRMASAANYRGVGTIEFLIDQHSPEPRFVFLEANARLQVEHTVTEEVTGFDLVAMQLEIAAGNTLAELGLEQSDIAEPRGVALQARVNIETMAADGSVRPGGGLITAYDPPSGPGVRVDGFGYTGYATSPHYDSLLAKLIVHADNLANVTRKTLRALAEFRIDGVRTNTDFLTALLSRAELTTVHTRYIEEHAAALFEASRQASDARYRYFSPERDIQRAGVQVDPDDPLAVLEVKSSRPAPTQQSNSTPPVYGPPGSMAVLSPMQGMMVEISVSMGDVVQVGQPLAVLEALKMEHVIQAETPGLVVAIELSQGDTIYEGTPILFVEPREVDGVFTVDRAADLDEIRDDLAEINHYKHLTSDAARTTATEKRHKGGKRTARENIEDLCDAGSFFEYGPLVTASRYTNDTPEELEHRITKTAADAMVMGVGRVNGDLVGRENSRCVAMSYDYTVLAGTQGGKNHQKQDRMFGVAETYRLPVVLFTEGGGGRTHGGSGAGGSTGRTPNTGGILNVRTWRELGKLSGLVPLVGVTSGYCFAGNVVLLGACDVIIATRDSSIGVGGPALIEGGGLGVFTPDEVGPVSIQEPNGVIDIVVEDEAEATAAAKHYLSFFQGRLPRWQECDQRVLRNIVPENRRAVYNVRTVIETLADVDSMLELRPKFGLAMVTAFIRVQGQTLGVIANNSNSPTGGAIDADAADKAARFMQLCDAFDIPILSMIDCPGNMVGPEAEKEALIRHCGRMYVAGANLTVPLFVVVLRKAYGLGALAMAGGSFDETFYAISWPTGEFAGMGLEGQIKLGRRAELAAITDIPKRKARYEELLADAYAWSRALNSGTVFEVDDVIDPAETRNWLIMGLDSAPPVLPRDGKKHAWVDTW